MHPTERRELPRVSIGIPAAIQCGGVTAVDARTIDVSKGGALIDSPIPVGNGEPVLLKVDPEMSCLGPIEGKVVRCRPAFWGRRHTVAVKFTEKNGALMDIVNLVYHLREGEADNAFPLLSTEDEAI